MGLDMYLRGEKFFWTNWEKPEENRTEDGIKVSRLEVELGYWRKHPNLHGFIVQTFANGEDECQRIDLDKERIQRIIKAIRGKEMPHTEGFFFGASDGSDEETANDIKQLEGALAWLAIDEPQVSRSVYYRASW